MKIDAHVYLGRSLFGYSQSCDEILRKLDALDIDRCVVCPVKPCGYNLGPENDFVASAVKEHGDRFFGLVRVDPRQGADALKEMTRGIEKLELQGLYLNPWEETCPVDSELLYPLLEMASKYGIVVMIKGGYPVVSHPSQIADLARRFPQTSMIATSGGQINISGGALQDARMMLEENKNVYMETSGIYREDFIEEMARVLGAERLIYGSGSPVLDMSFEIQRVSRAHIPQGDKKKIMGANLMKLIKRAG